MVDEAGDILPAGTQGELQFTGWSRMVGYYGLPPEDQPFTPDGLDSDRRSRHDRHHRRVAALSFGLAEGASLSQRLSGAGIGPGGRLPVNTHGGLMSATTSGIFHLIEAVRQLQGEAGPRQVEAPRIALVNNVGGAFSNHRAILLKAAHGV